jgi:DNA-binding LytR/AlgR family response regulator
VGETNILLLEDIDIERERFAAMLIRQGASVRAFSSAVELIENYAAEPLWPNGAILDIILDGQDLSGIDAARQLRERGFTGPVVFLSSSDEFGPETYEVEASGYLRKPATEDKAASALAVMARAINSAKARDSADLLVETRSSARRILFRDIIYLESVHNMIEIHLASGEVAPVRGTIGGFAETLLKDARFAQSHRAFIVNLDYVASMTPSEAVMLDGSKVFIAKGNTQFKVAFVRSRLS